MSRKFSPEMCAADQTGRNIFPSDPNDRYNRNSPDGLDQSPRQRL
jgi:hypothetical protein